MRTTKLCLIKKLQSEYDVVFTNLSDTQRKVFNLQIEKAVDAGMMLVREEMISLEHKHRTELALLRMANKQLKDKTNEN